MAINDGLTVRQLVSDIHAQYMERDGTGKLIPASGFFALGNAEVATIGNAGFELNPIRGTGTKTHGKNIDFIENAKDPEIVITLNTVSESLLAIALNSNLATKATIAGDTVTDEIQYGSNGQFIVLDNTLVVRNGTGEADVTITTPVASNGTGYLVNGAVAAGSTEIVVDTGTGTIAAGQTISIADYAYDHVVKTGITGVGTIVLQKPVVVGIPDTKAVSVVASKTLVAGTDFETDPMHSNYIQIADGVLGLGVTELKCDYVFNSRESTRLLRNRASSIILKLRVRSLDRKSPDQINTKFHICYVMSDSVVSFISSDTEPDKVELKAMPIFDADAQNDFEMEISRPV